MVLRKKKVSSEEPLSILRQCKLLDLAQSAYYYTPQPVSDEDLALMKLIDACYSERPFYSTSRTKDWLLDNNALVVNRKCIRSLRRLLAIEKLYSKCNLSLACHRHKVNP